MLYQLTRNRFCALMVMMVNGFEVEILEEGGDQISMESQLMQLSLYYFLGMNSPTIMKVRGRVGNTSMVIITHNFVSPVFTKKAHLTKTVNSRPRILLGTGIMVQGLGVCKDVYIHPYARF